MSVCGALKGDGQPCQRSIELGPAGMCSWHDERAVATKAKLDAARLLAREAKREAAAVADGEMEPVPPGPSSLEEANLWLGWTTRHVKRGLIDVRTAREISFSCRALMEGYSKQKMKERIKYLERLATKYEKLLKQQGAT